MAASISISLIPIFVFLLGLVAMDTYKLIKPQRILAAVLYGAAAAAACYFIYSYLALESGLSSNQLSRYVAPFYEETTKALFVIVLIGLGALIFNRRDC